MTLVATTLCIKQCLSVNSQMKYGESIDELVLTEAPYAYDAMWVFALALDKLMKQEPAARLSFNTKRVTRLVFADQTSPPYS